MKEQIGQWFREYKERLLTLLGIVLVGVLCFEAGLLQGKITTEKPLQLSLSPVPTLTPSEAEASPTIQVVVTPPFESRVAQVGESQCLYVGSKNSNKYHLPTCAVAKRIKPENRVCFVSKEAAEARGYVPSCIK
ncbi:MAG: hypothetical protein Q8O53_01175 [Candidatus Moranbacteria bacterium]|nr:hypothetical protein [Candidatus Moranbacteria bacterium]